MNSQIHQFYSNYNNNKSDTYKLLESLCQDVQLSWQKDIDETSSMKKIIEIIDGILLMTSLEEYFSNNKTDLDYFMGEFSKEVINHILYQEVVYGENGDDIALDLIFHFIKLFMHFHKHKEYAPLFEKIRKIFSKEFSNNYFVTPKKNYKKEINPIKGNTYEQYNEEFCKEYKKGEEIKDKFNIGDTVDVRVTYKGNRTSLDRYNWVRGIIIDIQENEYIIEYPGNSIYNSKISISIDSQDVVKSGTKTEDWDWRLSLKENDIIDCYDRSRWYPATIYKVTENKTENGLLYKEYSIGFRLYPDNFLDNSKYDYHTFLQCTVFWDNSNSESTDKQGNSFYGDGEGADEDIAFYSKRIQKFKKYTLTQKECLNERMSALIDSYNNSPTFGKSHFSNNNFILTNQKNSGEEKLKLMTELLENDRNEKNIEDYYLYEKDGKINYIIGKDTDNFSYYFAKLLKKMADNGFFEEMLDILKDKPTAEELYNIFYILMNCSSFIHKEYFKRNYMIFKNAFLDMIENLSSKEMRSFQKEVTDLASNFFITINYTISQNKNSKNEDMDEIYLTLAFRMIKSSIFDKKIQGLKTLGEYINNSTDENSKKYIISLIKKNEIIKNLFGTNYHSQIISKSNDILELMLKYNELSNDEIKLIWSLTNQNDLEAKMTIIKLFSNLIIHLNENYCTVLLECINEKDDKKLNENTIDLIYNLSIKANNESFMLKCIEYFCNSVLEVKNLSNLSKNENIPKILNLMAKREKYFQNVIDICENNLKSNKNILTTLFLLDEIIERFKNFILQPDKNNDSKNNFEYITKLIHKLIDNEKLLNLFKENFLIYKKIAKEKAIENTNEKSLKIDDYTHEENMKNRIKFLIKDLTFLYPKFDFFELLKEVCLHEPVFESDKLFLYDFMKKYISEEDKPDSKEKISKEQKIKIETQLFNMLTEENKTEMTLTQFNLYIEIFLNINSIKEFLQFQKNPNDEYTVIMDNAINIEGIFGIDKLWDLLFELNKEELTQKLINIIYSLYKNKDEIQKLSDKCVNIIKDIENITINKLEKCLKILKFIILDSETDGYIKIKSHFNLLKNCLIKIPMDLQKNKKTNTSVTFLFNSNKENDNPKNATKDLLYGNTSIMEIKQILAEKNNSEEKSIYIDFSYKENNSLKSKILGSSYNNISLKELLDLNIDNKKRETLSPNKFVFTGDKVEKEYIIQFNYINPKFTKMIKQWFYIFSNGNEIMDKDNIINFISRITQNQNVDENNSDYIKFMHDYDKEQKDFILEEEFCQYYKDLAKKDLDKIREHMKIMKFREDFNKISETASSESIDNLRLPRFILANDKDFHNSLIKIFSKLEKKMNIYEFLFFLSTNIEKYNELLENSQNKIFDESNNRNYLEQLYQLIIIESFLQDLQIEQLDLKSIFKENKKEGNKSKDNKEYKIIAKKYMPFDDESNLIKKISFLLNFIENKGYEQLIKYVETLLECTNDNKDDEQIRFKCCKIGLNIINIIHKSFQEKNNIKENSNKIDIYYLDDNINIKKLINLKNSNLNENKNIINEDKKEDQDNKEELNKEENKKEENNNEEKENKENDNKEIDNVKEDINDIEFNKLKEIVLNISYLNLTKKLISFLLNSELENSQSLSEYCFNLLMNLIISNESLNTEIKKNNEIRELFSKLIKKNINSPKSSDKFFIESLIKNINNLSSAPKDINKLNYEFLSFIFEISNSLFKELVNENKKENNSYSLFFDLFNSLFKVILNNNEDKNIDNKLSNDFISNIYELLYKDLKEQNQNKKFSEDTFLGFMKILITAIKSNQLKKNQIISKKINDETLFDIIYNIILPENNNKINNEDDFKIENVLKNLDDKSTNTKFLEIEKCNEIINQFNINSKRKNAQAMSQKIYDIYNEFILMCLKGSTNPELISKLIKIVWSKKNISSSNGNNFKKKKVPKSFGYVGLKNNGCICYLNSILQQMYMVPPFKYAIMSSDDKKSKNIQISLFNNNRYDDNLLHQLQKIYTFLTYSEKQAVNSKDFCASYKDFDGAPINPLIQQDSQEFYNNFCDKIENCLKETKYKYIIDNIFTGKTCSSVICEKCHTVSNRFEDFYNLTLEVKNINSLYESLQKLIIPEKIEQFNCEVCKEKVTISKRTSLAKLPNVLIVHLKRFYMDYEIEQTQKINSKFEFPNILNLKNFCIEEINKNNSNGESYETDEIYPKIDEYYEYELKGINIHMGNAQGGHYVSFIDIERDGHDNELNIKSSIENDIIKSKWLKFNDSIITEFDPKDIPIESYGGLNNSGNENIQNAYLLIYERKKKTPIKIVLDKDIIHNISVPEKNLNNDKVISFGKEQKPYINKFYDISNSNKEKRVNEEELYSLIFHDEESKEYYSFVPYYNIDKEVLKENFIEVIEKNKKFFENQNKIIENSKYKDECDDILFETIHLKDFNVMDNKFSLMDKNRLILFFQEQIFGNKIFKANSLTIEDEQKIIINDKAKIFLEKLILPIINYENKDNEYNQLLQYIANILLSKTNLENIFETSTRVFDIKNVKLFAEIIYSMIVYFNENMDIQQSFKNIFKMVEQINDEFNYTFYNNNIYNEVMEKKQNDTISPLYYLYDLIFKIIKLNPDLIEYLISQEKLSTLILRINNTKSIEIRKIIYAILSCMIDNCYDYTLIIKGKNYIQSDEKEQLQQKFLKSKKLLKRLFNENPELLGKLLKILEYKDKEFTNKFNNLNIQFLFNQAIKEKKLTQMMDLLYEIINIKDQLTLNRLYLLMGYPEMIFKQQIKEDQDTGQDEDDNDDEDNIKKEKNDEDDQKKKEKHFWPLFGYRLIKKSENGEVFKYVNNIKIYETHCILAKLFPCSSDELYANQDFIKGEQKLTEEEKNKYIYKLLCISLLNEGNYCLFKYIYLTQSRFIIKYNNLYEEMIDILLKAKNYDLTEIEKNAEICIKRINFEVNRIKCGISHFIKKNIDKDNENAENLNDINYFARPPPELPEKMKEKYKEKDDDIEEFIGFIPNIIPDSIYKAVYSLIGLNKKMLLIFVKYYTSFKDIESIRKNETKEDIKEEENQIIEKEEDEEKDIIIENIKNVQNLYDEENKNANEESDIYEVEKIKMSEKLFIENESSRLLHEKKLIIQDKTFKNKTGQLAFVRYLLLNNYPNKIMLRAHLKEVLNSSEIKYNFYIPSFVIGSAKARNFTDIINIYRRNKIIDFINQNSINININIKDKREFSDDNYFFEWSSDNEFDLNDLF